MSDTLPDNNYSAVTRGRVTAHPKAFGKLRQAGSLYVPGSLLSPWRVNRPIESLPTRGEWQRLILGYRKYLEIFVEAEVVLTACTLDVFGFQYA